MRRYAAGILFALATMLVLSGCGGEPDPSTLEAVKGTASLDVANAVWSSAPVLTVAAAPIDGIEGATPAATIKVQAVYNDTDIWMRFEWPDPTKSQTRLWTYDGTSWSKGGNEDRLGLYWQISTLDKFGTKGCNALCHDTADNPDEWYMISPKDGQRADNWHWKAQRALPVGYVDDKWLGGVLEDPTDVESANHGDSKDSGGYSANASEDGKSPAFMPPNLGSAVLIKSEAVPIDVSMITDGVQIPRELIERPIGSRGDIDSMAVYDNATWITVMHRKLDTGNNDDVQFNPARSYPFGVAVFDNAGGFKHAISQEALFLKFK
ncbi:MAG: hypothetical protein HQ475_07180 [SAR202 cluster bacterium]|nr:hypothetical protein [SAR202 cluster bacterium]